MSIYVAFRAHELPAAPVGSRWEHVHGPVTVFVHTTYEDAFDFWVEIATEADNEVTWEYASSMTYHLLDVMRKQFIAKNSLSPNMPADNRRVLGWETPYKERLYPIRKTWDYRKPKSPYKLKAASV